jgi:hypothetical protein
VPPSSNRLACRSSARSSGSATLPGRSGSGGLSSTLGLERVAATRQHGQREAARDDPGSAVRKSSQHLLELGPFELHSGEVPTSGRVRPTPVYETLAGLLISPC